MASGIIRAELLHFQVTDRLRDMILAGEIKPGERISERALCELFGISRTPLREALKVLAADGLIELLPRRGAVVTEISPELLKEKFEVVRLIEAHAAEVVCVRADADDITALDEQREKIEAAVEKKQSSRYLELSGQFHLMLVKLAGNQTLAAIHADLVGHLVRARLVGLRAQPVGAEFGRSHRRIVTALKRKDAEAAAEAVVAHMNHVEEVVLAAAERKPRN
jgi:DNA-binding GntR family transcriptional regulator